MRIEGITIDDNKHLSVGLTAIYGIGRSRAREILDTLDLSHDTKAADITEEQDKKIREIIEGFTVEGDLRRKKENDIKRLKDISTYRGTRHTKNLPAHGQNTQTNSRTNRPYKGYKTAGSGKRSVEKK
ncbi:MAG: 30S ribosomal protein S13 [Candidatus Paceibacterota bacterium]